MFEALTRAIRGTWKDDNYYQVLNKNGMYTLIDKKTGRIKTNSPKKFRGVKLKEKHANN